MKTIKEESEHIETNDGLVACLKLMEIRSNKIDEIVEWINKYEANEKLGDKTKFERNLPDNCTIETYSHSGEMSSNDFIKDLTKQVTEDLCKQLKASGIKII